MDPDDLYGLPLDRFVAERNALAKTLRADGERDQAAEVAALRKPSVAAWAVNQLVRTQRGAVAELLQAGDALREAQQQVLEGRGDGRSLRAAVERERAAVDELTSTAGGLLSSEGQDLSQAVLDRVAETLRAAALDDDAREQVRAGRLERELRHVGLGGLAAGDAPAPRDAPAPPRRSKRDTETEGTERAAAKARADARTEARAAEREARRRVERATRAVAGARERRDRAAQALSEAQVELDRADAERQDAEARLQEAKAAVRELGERAR
jgi:hypothetical protein